MISSKIRGTLIFIPHSVPKRLYFLNNRVSSVYQESTKSFQLSRKYRKLPDFECSKAGCSGATNILHYTATDSQFAIGKVGIYTAGQSSVYFSNLQVELPEAGSLPMFLVAGIVGFLMKKYVGPRLAFSLFIKLVLVLDEISE